MNGAVAKAINDDYLVRCAQILNNCSQVLIQTETTEDSKTKKIITIKADGIKISDGTILPITDHFDTLAVYRSKDILTINLVGTDYVINMSVKDAFYFFRSKNLGIQYKHSSTYLDEEKHIQKVSVRYSRPQRTVGAIYASYESEILEPIFYIEEYIEHKGCPPKINVVLNKELFKQPDSTIMKYIREKYNEVFKDVSDDERQKIELAMCAYYKEHLNDVNISEIPESIRQKLGIKDVQKESNKDGSIDENNGSEAYNEGANVVSFKELLSSSIYASTFDFDDSRDIPELCSSVQEAYENLYTQIIQKKGIDYYTDYDVLGNSLDMSDEDLTDPSYYDDEDLAEDTVDSFDDNLEEESSEENDYSEQICDESSKEVYKITPKYSFYSQDESCGFYGDITDELPKEQRADAIQKVLMELKTEDYSFFNFNTLIEAMIRVIDDFENNQGEHTQKHIQSQRPDCYGERSE